jgi:hypothetical protein
VADERNTTNDLCDACGKTLNHITGCSICLSCTSSNEDVEICKSNLGKYVLGKTYRVCFECMLKSYGVKP